MVSGPDDSVLLILLTHSVALSFIVTLLFF